MNNSLMKIEFDDNQVQLIKSQIAPKATESELKLFLYQCQRTGLDPLARQIYCIHRRQKDGDRWIEKMSIQTSIDGFRVTAERSGLYAGQSEPTFVYDDKGALMAAKITVYRFTPGFVRYEAAIGVAFWNEYVPREGQDMMWKKMPHTMLSKVAEAVALRKAFPQDLSGLYTKEEMEQEKTEDVPHEVVTIAVEPTFDSPEDKAAALDSWDRSLKDCKDMKEVVKLYNSAKSTVDGWQALKEMFADRRKELTEQTPAQ